MKVRIVKRKELVDVTQGAPDIGVTPKQVQSEKKLAETIQAWIGDLREQKLRTNAVTFEMLFSQ